MEGIALKTSGEPGIHNKRKRGFLEDAINQHWE